MELTVSFEDRALREWRKLDGKLRSQFKKKLAKLTTGVEAPSPKNWLRGFNGNCYKIKARSYRLVYEYQDDWLVILVIAVGKRNRNAVYDLARQR
ncbi:MAG: type II toxin-antitoxin system RelE/ParE family toxin [Pseudomonadota bacterium]|nr:type II toxin-antitoxin system RelE/ParE family toxin [Pseudomonadota bacterium]